MALASSGKEKTSTCNPVALDKEGRALDHAVLGFDRVGSATRQCAVSQASVKKQSIHIMPTILASETVVLG